MRRFTRPAEIWHFSIHTLAQSRSFWAAVSRASVPPVQIAKLLAVEDPFMALVPVRPGRVLIIKLSSSPVLSVT